MNRRSRIWWAAWAAGALASLAVLAWISVAALDLDRRESAAQAELLRVAEAGDALWRMDSWMALVLAQEAGRAWYEYSPYYEAGGSYTTLLNEIPKGAILTRSPLLTYESELFPLHFELRAEAAPRSPQVPLGNLRDLAQATCVAAPRMNARDAALEEAAAYLDYASLLPRVREASREAADAAVEEPPQVMAQSEDLEAETRQQKQGKFTGGDYQSRNQATQNAKQKIGWVAEDELKKSGLDLPAEDDPDTVVGPLVPLWVPHAEAVDGHQLLFLRRVRHAGAVLLQGFRVDWGELSAALRERLGAVAERSTLKPDLGMDIGPGAGAAGGSAAPDGGKGLRLATLPVRLTLAAVPVPSQGVSAWTGGMLAVGWAVVLATILLTGLALRGSVRWAQSRSRFASAVTHELRTPLTTFRLYTDLLRGARDEEGRREYLDVLESESARLARLVENVLDHARLEDGRRPEEAGPVRVEELLARCRDALELRCADAGAALLVEDATPEGCVLLADLDGVERILANLVDNACKYGVSAEGGGEVRLTARAEDGHVLLRVCDDGPGLRPEQQEAVFRLFDRAGRDSSDAQPGIGLGLALARGLAEEWGGSLHYEPAEGGGACFLLRLRRVRTAG